MEQNKQSKPEASSNTENVGNVINELKRVIENLSEDKSKIELSENALSESAVKIESAEKVAPPKKNEINDNPASPTGSSPSDADFWKGDVLGWGNEKAEPPAFVNEIPEVSAPPAEESISWFSPEIETPQEMIPEVQMPTEPMSGEKEIPDLPPQPSMEEVVSFVPEIETPVDIIPPPPTPPRANFDETKSKPSPLGAEHPLENMDSHWEISDSDKVEALNLLKDDPKKEDERSPGNPPIAPEMILGDFVPSPIENPVTDADSHPPIPENKVESASIGLEGQGHVLQIEGVFKPEGLFHVACLYPKDGGHLGQKFIKKLKEEAAKAKSKIDIEPVFVNEWGTDLIDLEAWCKTTVLSGADRMFILVSKKEADLFKEVVAKPVMEGVSCRLIFMEQLEARALYLDIVVELGRRKNGQK